MTLTTAKLITLIGIVLLVVIINFALFSALRNRSLKKEIDMFTRTSKSITQPFAQEDQQLADLSKAVADLKHKPPKPPIPPEH